MTDPIDDWANLAENLGVSEEAAAKPEEPAPRGRGRRKTADGEDAPRRRRRGPKPEAAPVAEPEMFAAGIEVDSDTAAIDASTDSLEAPTDGEPRKRRRRRPRRKKVGAESGPIAGTEGIPTVNDETGDSDDGEEVDLTPIETYSSLNIPSWYELIDGLYKP